MKIHTSFRQGVVNSSSTTTPGPNDDTSSPLGKIKHTPGKGGSVRLALQMCLSGVQQLKAFAAKMSSPNKNSGPGSSGSILPGPDGPLHERQLRPHTFGGMVEPVFTSNTGTVYSSIITQNSGNPIQARPLPPIPGENGGGSSKPALVYADLDFPGTGSGNSSSKTQHAPGPNPDPGEHIYEAIDTSGGGRTQGVQHTPLPPIPGENGGEGGSSGGSNSSSKTQHAPGPTPDPNDHIYEEIDTSGRGRT